MEHDKSKDLEEENLVHQFLHRMEQKKTLESLSMDHLFRLSHLGTGINAALHTKLVLERMQSLQELQDQQARLDAQAKELRDFDNKLGELQRGKPIRLNVGGTFFAATPEHLCQREPKSFFAVLFSGRWELRLEDGALFIDRSPLVFPLVLEYLRGGELDASELTKNQLRLLRADADFYQLDGLLDFFRHHPLALHFGEFRGSVHFRKDHTVAVAGSASMCLAVGNQPLARPFELQRVEILTPGCIAVGLAPMSALPALSSTFTKKTPLFLKVGAFPRTFDHGFYQWDGDHVGPGSVVAFQLHDNGAVTVTCDDVPCGVGGSIAAGEELAPNPQLPPNQDYFLVAVLQATGCSVKILS